ncbi:MAG: hypothetical protein IPH20_18250 [Bacteroidales bacterium]|nr:hypothetical protein [Bacteroidales bacterium]
MMKISNQPFVCITALLSMLLFISLPERLLAQDVRIAQSPDSLSLRLADSLATLKFMLSEIQGENAKLRTESSQLAERSALLAVNLEELKAQQAELITFNDSLNRQISGLSIQVQQKNEMLESQLRLQREKEQLFAEKEQLYKDAINSSMIDKVTLEGKISAKDSRLEGKDREISLLQLNIDEKNRDIYARNAEMQKLMAEKALADQKADTLLNNLTRTEKNLLLTGEQLKYTELKLKDCEGRYSSLTNKKKKTKVVQGFAIKNNPTPDYVLAPKDAENPSVYVISNQNSSSIEFDFITGASVMLKDLSKPGGSLTYDVGFFVGFGGSNLFKNFYFGPNFKLFDVLHINLGANVAQYEVLKSGFDVGDELPVGVAIPTTNEWKINGYFGLTFDLELITMIGKR